MNILPNTYALSGAERSLPWRVLQALWPPTLLVLLAWLAFDITYLLGHSLVELFSIVVAITAMLVATTSRDFTRNHFVIYVAVAIGWCAVLDLLHTQTFKGMHLLPNDSANPATQFWIAARFMQAVALVSAPLLLRRSVRVGWLHLGFGAWSVLCTVLIALGLFPDAYVDGQGLTPFKIFAEYLIIALLGGALLLFWRQRFLMSGQLFFMMSAAALTMMVSEFAFTQYVSVYAHTNLIGHLLKIYAYWFVYLALVQSALREPFGMLARAASTYDAVPDPTLIVAADGSIRQANHAAALLCGRSAATLVEQSSHTLFHEPKLPLADCPVCSRLNHQGQGFVLELELADQRVVECSVAPFIAAGNERTWVQVVRDVSERRRLIREREILICDLGERMKELSCLYATSELMKHGDGKLGDLLQGTVEILPSGFLLPASLRVALDSDWGHFGATWPNPAPAQFLHEPIVLDARSVGQLRVWYAGKAPAGDHFLVEEHALLQNITHLVGEALTRRQTAERLQRLSYCYELLSATNHAVARSRSRGELLEALFQALLVRGTFPMFFIAMTDNGQMPLQLLMQHGVAPERLPQLEQLLADPASPLGQIYAELDAGQTICHAMPYQGDVSALQAWQHYLLQRDISQRAALPLMCDGRIVGVVGLYVSGLAAFDEEQLRLLNEVASNMAFALESLSSQQRGQAAEQQAQLMEHRFEEVFRASPVPMQIHAVDAHRLRAINVAHQRWLGYALDDIASEDAWFTRIYADPAQREQLRTTWQQALEAARQGQLVVSPELTMTCKDGSVRVASGTMTVVGDDAIIAWTDLTDIRRSEQALRDSEQRFRSMVEQTISGMYVRRDGRFIYVNPRYCELTGWSPDELIGRDETDFTSTDQANLQRVLQARDELRKAETSNVAYSVQVRRKDGTFIELGLNSKRITWDDGLPASIVMAQDITARKHAEDRIAAYVKQLEGAMRATLQAVSNMVEMRDPYTAGHERRVGLIASDLAQEMGWSAERCDHLELLGLVHDIGKIAVPSEILTKPTRLSRLEMEMMRGHAQAGHDILKDVPFPMPVAEIILQHHERMDGSGYPQGLKGDAILPEARVLAVADVLESISSHRPYRPALGIDAGLAELQNNRGILYDAEVVDAAVRLVQQKAYVLPA